MKLCNVEVFAENFTFKDAFQAIQKKYKEDYLSIEKNTIEVQAIKASKGDYIRILQSDRSYYGIVDEVKKKKGILEITYKAIMSIFDVNVKVNKEELETESFENWIKTIMENLYKNNADTFQNKFGFCVKANSETKNATLDLDKSIVNLYKDILKKALLNYEIVVSATMNFATKTLEIEIGRADYRKKHIEGDLSNVVNAEVVSKNSGEFINKVTVYNDKNKLDICTFYLTKSGNVKSNTEQQERLLPVIADVTEVSFEAAENKTFYDTAYEKAFGMLNKGKYDNLIEIELYYEDALVEPMKMQMGQEVEIMMKGEVYKTILTGREEKEKTVVLIFGAVRLELTKILKERM